MPRRLCSPWLRLLADDLLEFQTTPCVEDAEAGEVMASLKR